MAKKITKLNQYKTQYQITLTDKRQKTYFEETFGTITPANVYKQTSVMAEHNRDAIGHVCGAEEFYWISQGKQNVVLNSDFIDMLQRATFTLGAGASIYPMEKLESFCLSTPKGKIIIDELGIPFELPAILVSIMPVKKWEETISKQYHIISGFKVKPTVGLTQNPDESVISIFHRDNDDVVYCTTEGLSKLPEILKNGGYSKETNLNNQHFNQLETSRNNAIIRLVAAFLIYTSAKDTLNLKQGYPVDTTIDMEKGFTKAYWSTYHVNYVPSWKGKKNLEDVTPCHFENITDPDAYKGIDSWIPVGSLWKLVDEH